ncbi:hypothetical protein [Actinoplanes sp. TFC3]|uniref:dTMP kinase n=1 Tax=Actinoplanes sp. TFC3 TaxID=1710355 RepID=UPI000831FCAF|nr:hypothetical protein [Actinoplanes sp. TFC3]
MSTSLSPVAVEERVWRHRTVALMGIDGAGKTTQTRLLAGHLRADGVDALPLTNDAGGAIRGALDGYARSQGHPDHASLLGDKAAYLAWAVTKATSLHAAAHLLEDRPDAVLVADRYTYCHYATDRLQGTDAEPLLRALHAGIPEPDVAIFIDVDPALAARRTRERGHGVETVDTLTRYRRAYVELDEFSRFTVVDGTAQPAEVHRRVVQVLATESGRPQLALPCGCA